MIQKSISVGAKAVGPAACTFFSKREKGEYVRFNFSNVIAIVTLFIALMLSGAPQMWGQTQDTIPNGDGDLLWELPLYDNSGGRWANDAVFHPINGNIIAAVNWEIWEISPIDGHFIRKFEDSVGSDPFARILITNDGNTIITNRGRGRGLIIWDYMSGKPRKTNVFFTLQDSYVSSNDFDLYPVGTRLIITNYTHKLIIYDYENETIIKEASYFALEGGEFQYKWRPVQMTLSNDGTLLAVVGARYLHSDLGDPYHSFELWDGERLTHIKDFQNPDNPRWAVYDPQISSDNQWVLYGRWLYKIATGERVDIPGFNKYDGFAFSNDGKKLFVIGRFNTGEYGTRVINLDNMKIIYEYKTIDQLVRFNKENQIVSMKYPTYNLAFYSSNWTTVGVRDKSTNEQIIKEVKYERGILSIVLNIQQSINKITITDITGKTIYVGQNLTTTNGQLSIELPLLSGVYFVTLYFNKNTYTTKFIVAN